MRSSKCTADESTVRYIGPGGAVRRTHNPSRRRITDDRGYRPTCSDPAIPVEWARRAERGPFDTIAILDRLVYDNPEPVIAPAAIAAVTTRIRLQTEVVPAPLRDTALLAKQSATLDRISNGRFTLGVGDGGRVDDYHAAGIDIRTRGKRLDTQLDRMRLLWAGEPFSDEAGPIGPRPARRGRRRDGSRLNRTGTPLPQSGPRLRVTDGRAHSIRLRPRRNTVCHRESRPRNGIHRAPSGSDSRSAAEAFGGPVTLGPLRIYRRPVPPLRSPRLSFVLGPRRKAAG